MTLKQNENQLKRIPGRPSLPQGFKVDIGGTVLLAEQPELLGEDKNSFREAYERNVQKRLTNY